MRGATDRKKGGNHAKKISIHAPRAGRDRGERGRQWHCPRISIHAPRAGRDTQRMAEAMQELISIHAPRAGRDHCKGSRRKRQSISIHAPRAGRDGKNLSCQFCGNISIHAPRAGRDRRSCRPPGRPTGFQSTRPVRGATLHHAAPPSDPLFQSTRPVRGATSNSPHLKTPKTISIHAPRAGRDNNCNFGHRLANNFNPRTPCGARHQPPDRGSGAYQYFNPCAPCGARRGFVR